MCFEHDVDIAFNELDESPDKVVTAPLPAKKRATATKKKRKTNMSSTKLTRKRRTAKK